MNKGMIKCPHCKKEFKADDVLQEHLDRVAEQEKNLNEQQTRINNAKKIYRRYEGKLK